MLSAPKNMLVYLTLTDINTARELHQQRLSKTGDTTVNRKDGIAKR
jgi:hypothetical protein